MENPTLHIVRFVGIGKSIRIRNGKKMFWIHTARTSW